MEIEEKDVTGTNEGGLLSLHALGTGHMHRTYRSDIKPLTKLRHVTIVLGYKRT